MHDLNDVQFFVAVVESQGFSAAARNLNLPKSSVSRRVSSLEARLGVRLIERSPRSLRLTEVGVSFYERCRAILADLDAAEREVAVQRGEPIGLVRMSCPTGLAQFVLAKILPGFLFRYPKVRLQVLATNRKIDLVDDNVDIAIRVRVRPADEALMMRMLYRCELLIRGEPDVHVNTAESGLHRYPVVVSFPQFSGRLATANVATQRPKRSDCDDLIRSGIEIERFYHIVRAAAAGLGIALLPAEVVEDEVRTKRLIRILPDWHCEEVSVHLVFTTNRGIVPGVRVLIDYLAEHFKFRSDNQPKRKKLEKAT
jgi:DNA-binding transcriptional LysR family regulator